MKPERRVLALKPTRSVLGFRFTTHSHGFTLIELLTVLSIIAIITTIVSVNLSGARKQARDVRRKTDVQAIQSAIELYANANNGKVPISQTPSWSTSGQPWLGGTSLLNYLSVVPVDPLNTSPYLYSYQTGNTTETVYSYIIDAALESEPTANANLTNVSMVPSDTGFFVTGTYVNNGVVHYRVSSGGKQQF